MRWSTFIAYIAIPLLAYDLSTSVCRAESAVDHCKSGIEAPFEPVGETNHTSAWWRILAACAEPAVVADPTIPSRERKAIAGRVYLHLGEHSESRSEIRVALSEGSTFARVVKAFDEIRVGRTTDETVRQLRSVLEMTETGLVERLSRAQSALLLLQLATQASLQNAARLPEVKAVFDAASPNLVRDLYRALMGRVPTAVGDVFSENFLSLPSEVQQRAAELIAAEFGWPSSGQWLCSSSSRWKADGPGWVSLVLSAALQGHCKELPAELDAAARAAAIYIPSWIKVRDLSDAEILSVPAFAQAFVGGDQGNQDRRRACALAASVGADHPVRARMLGVRYASPCKGSGNLELLVEAADLGDLPSQLQLIQLVHADSGRRRAVAQNVAKRRARSRSGPPAIGRPFLQLIAPLGEGKAVQDEPALATLLQHVSSARSNLEAAEALRTFAPGDTKFKLLVKSPGLSNWLQPPGYSSLPGALTLAISIVGNGCGGAGKELEHFARDLPTLRETDTWVVGDLWQQALQMCADDVSPFEMFSAAMYIEAAQAKQPELADEAGESRLQLIPLKQSGISKLLPRARAAVQMIAETHYAPAAVLASVRSKGLAQARLLLKPVLNGPLTLASAHDQQLERLDGMIAKARTSKAANDLVGAYEAWQAAPFQFQFPQREFLELAAAARDPKGEFYLATLIEGEEESRSQALFERASRHGSSEATDLLLKRTVADADIARAYVYAERLIGQHRAAADLDGAVTLFKVMGFRLEAVALIQNAINQQLERVRELGLAPHPRMLVPAQYELYQLQIMKAEAYGTPKPASALDSLRAAKELAGQIDWDLWEVLVAEEYSHKILIGTAGRQADRGGAQVAALAEYYVGLVHKPTAEELIKKAFLAPTLASSDEELSNVADLFAAHGYDAAAQALHLLADEQVSKASSAGENFSYSAFRACALAKAAQTAKSSGDVNSAIALLQNAVEQTERVRTAIGTSSNRLGICFAKQNEDIYRSLAGLLLEQKRLGEAEATMSLMYFNHMRDGLRSRTRMASPPAKSKLSLARARANARKLFALIRRNPESYFDQKRSFQLDRSKRQINITQASPIPTLGLTALPAELRSPRVAFIRYLQLNDKIVVELVLVSGTKMFNLPESRSDIRDLVVQFRLALDHGNPRGPAELLYDKLIRPLSKDLESAEIDLLAIQQDDTLSYVPFAALHDGRQWLAERYATVSFYGAHSKSKESASVPASGQMAAFAVGRGFRGYSPLPAAREEVENLMLETSREGVFPGRPAIDADFTPAALTLALKKRPKFLHIATHFTLGSTAYDSVILFGSGEEVSLADLDNLLGTDLSYLKLVTLSACTTAVGGGRDLPSLAVMLGEKGAGAVMASLWPVNDASTAKFMKEFYRKSVAQPDTPLPYILQQVQKDMVRVIEVPDQVVEERGAQPLNQPAEPGVGWSHPFHWAPFLLLQGAR